MSSYFRKRQIESYTGEKGSYNKKMGFDFFEKKRMANITVQLML